MIGTTTIRSIAFVAAMSCFFVSKIRAQEVITEEEGEEQTASVQEDEEEVSDMGMITAVPFHFELGVHGGYDDNARLSRSGGGSVLTKEEVKISYDLPNERPHLHIDSGANFTYYPELGRGRHDTLNAFLNSSLVYPYSPRLKLAVNFNGAYRTEPDFSSDVGVENRLSNFLQISVGGSGSYNWTPTFSTVTSENFRVVRYDSSMLAFFLDRNENTIGQEFRLAVVPESTVLALTYRFQTVDYETFFPRDSTTNYLLAGFDKNFNPYLKATFRGGATVRSFNNSGAAARVDPHFETSVSYDGAHNSILSWTTSYGVEQPNSRIALTRTTFRTGLELAYDVTARIRATTHIFYHIDQNEAFFPNPDFSSDAFEISFGLRYAFSGRLSAVLDYRHSEFSSDGPMRNSSHNRYSGGVTFSY